MTAKKAAAKKQTGVRKAPARPAEPLAAELATMLAAALEGRLPAAAADFEAANRNPMHVPREGLRALRHHWGELWA